MAEKPTDESIKDHEKRLIRTIGTKRNLKDQKDEQS